MRDQLSTTHYAVLGLLAVRPWSAYELTKQVERGLRWFWPRSGNKLYEVPKRLADLDLAHGRQVAAGRRNRTEYTITPAGRRELARWLGGQPTPPMFEYDALVRVLLADHGSKEQLLATVATIRSHALAMQTFGGTLGREYSETGGGPFPERLHVNALIFEFLWRYTEAIRTWAEWASAEVQRWDGVGPQPERTRVLLSRYEEAAREVERRTGGRQAPERRGRTARSKPR